MNEPLPTAESDAGRCAGTGTPALNVGRGFVGNRLAMVGDCQTCKRRPEVTKDWAVKYHRTRVTSPGSGDPS